MHFCNMDAYYHMATQGDSEAFQNLYLIFVKKAKLIIKHCTSLYKEFHLECIDFTPTIDSVFSDLLNDFDQSKSSFSSYLDFLLDNRLTPTVKNNLFDYVNQYAPNLEWNEKDRDMDLFIDEDLPDIHSSIVVSDFKARMASSNKYKSKPERLKTKVLLLQYAGCKKGEICKALKISYGQLRTILEQFKDDEELINLKLELK